MQAGKNIKHAENEKREEGIAPLIVQPPDTLYKLTQYFSGERPGLDVREVDYGRAGGTVVSSSPIVNTLIHTLDLGF